MAFNVEKVQSVEMKPVAIPEVDDSSFEEQTFNYELSDSDKNMGLMVESESDIPVEESSEKKSLIAWWFLDNPIRKSFFQLLKFDWNLVKDISSGKGVLNSYKDMYKEVHQMSTSYIEDHPVASYFTGSRTLELFTRLMLGKEETKSD